MDRIVAFFAPRSRSDFLVKWLVILLLINLLNILVSMAVTGLKRVEIANEVMMVALVGGPFITLALAMLSHQRALQGQLAALAATDVLTGLRNRRAFLIDAGAAHADGDGGAVLLLDADHFKQINDSFGHDVGDICLREIASHLRSMVREEDVVGRLGGEEFGIYLRNASPERARVVGERICRGVNVVQEQPKLNLRITLSAGAVLAQNSLTIEQGLTIADRALYLAKQAGRARVIFAPAEAAKAVPSEMRAATLRTAVG